MKTNYIPAIVMLLAGAVYCLFAIRTGVLLWDFTVQLLIVLVVFYILGGIIKMVLNQFMGEVKEKDEKEELTADTESEDKQEEGKPEEEEKVSENKEET